MTRVVLFALLIILSGCYKEEALPIAADFDYTAVSSGFTVPVTVSFTNTTTGAETFSWSFEGGEPSTSAKKTPEEIVYRKPGTYTVQLKARNFDGVEQVVEKQIVIDDQLHADFSFTVSDNKYAPATVIFSSLSAGELKLEWSFEGGTPAASTEKNPTVRFENGGNHKVSLKIFNSRESVVKDSILELEPELIPDFEIVVPKQYEELEAPVEVQLTNRAIGSTSQQWTLTGADVPASQAKEPIVRFSKPGIYTLELAVSNGKKSKTISKSLTVKPSKGYAYIKDAELGIFSAHQEVGVFYSTFLRKSFKESDPLSGAEAASIDLLFFGLDDDFSYNRFLSPTEAASVGLDAVTGVGKTLILNPVNVPPGILFESLDATRLNALNLAASNGELDDSFDMTGPKLIVFENSQKKKGVILLKEFIKDGLNSRIRFDIKVLK